MTEQSESAFEAGVELARRINRSAANQFAKKGLDPVQIGMAAVFSAFDIAERLHDGNGVAAVEWMRTALDTIEKNIMEGGQRA